MRQPKVTAAEMIAIHNLGAIGVIELRNWLAEEFPGFRAARRSDVDDHFEKLGTNQVKDQEEVEDLIE